LARFHQKRHRDFKTYYQNHVCKYLNAEFPNLPSYQRFVQWIPRALIPLTAYLFAQLGSCSGITFVDSTPLVVCHNRRIHSHKTFKNLAARGHTSVGWFFGFKLHLLFNDQGQIVWLQLTPGNTDDRKGMLEMIENPLSTVFGKLIGDKGYVSQALLIRLGNEFGIQMVTRLKKKMHTKLPMLALDACLLRKRAIGPQKCVETCSHTGCCQTRLTFCWHFPTRSTFGKTRTTLQTRSHRRRKSIHSPSCNHTLEAQT
jgi:hypothetical protein